MTILAFVAAPPPALTAAGGLAFAAGVCAVLAAWELLGVLDARGSLGAVGRVLAPLRGGLAPATAGERRRLALVGAATLAAAAFLLAGPVAAVAAGLAGPLAVRQVLAWRAARRRAEVARGAPAAARAIADALAGGHSVRGALAAAAALDGAVGDELRRAAAALALGEPTPRVLARLRTRARDQAWDTLTAAILLQSEAGGDLASLLRDLAARLDEARRAEADARSATAQARFTAWLVAALPVAAAILAELAAPGFFAGLLAAPLTGLLVGASVLLQLAAVVCVRRITR